MDIEQKKVTLKSETEEKRSQRKQKKKKDRKIERVGELKSEKKRISETEVRLKGNERKTERKENI